MQTLSKSLMTVNGARAVIHMTALAWRGVFATTASIS